MKPICCQRRFERREAIGQCLEQDRGRCQRIIHIYRRTRYICLIGMKKKTWKWGMMRRDDERDLEGSGWSWKVLVRRSWYTSLDGPKCCWGSCKDLDSSKEGSNNLKWFDLAVEPDEKEENRIRILLWISHEKAHFFLELQPCYKPNCKHEHWGTGVEKNCILTCMLDYLA